MSNLAEVRQPETKIELGGRAYALVYNFNTWALLEEHYGSMEAAMDALQNAQSLKGKPATEVRFFLWAGMVQNAPDLTLKDVGALITFGSLSALTTAVMDAVNGSMSQGDDSGE